MGNYLHAMISIHAPVKGATCPPCRIQEYLEISIHAPVKGATLPRFQTVQSVAISIHAPVKGATRCWRISRAGSRNFNPRSREGSDAFQQLYDRAERISIHAPVKGATAAAAHAASWSRISIHAPAKGATSRSWTVLDSAIISIHAPAKGATQAGERYREHVGHFNPRSREGSDFGKLLRHIPAVISIHAPAKGATPHTVL